MASRRSQGYDPGGARLASLSALLIDSASPVQRPDRSIDTPLQEGAAVEMTEQLHNCADGQKRAPPYDPSPLSSKNVPAARDAHGSAPTKVTSPPNQATNGARRDSVGQRRKAL